MGNSSSSPTSNQQQLQQQHRRSIHLPEDEKERKFREKIGVIEVVRNHTGGSSDHVSSLKVGSSSWATSVTDDFSHASRRLTLKENDESTSTAAATENTKIEEGEKVTMASALGIGVSSETESTRMNQKSAMTPKTESETFSKYSFTRQSLKKREQQQQQQQQQEKQNYSPVVSPGLEVEVIRLTDGLISQASGLSCSQQQEDTEALLANMQTKFAAVDLQQQTCLQQIQQMNEEMDQFQQDSAERLKPKDHIITQKDEEISQLKKELLRMKAERQVDGSHKTTELRNLVRKVAVLKNNLLIVEQQRDAAIAAAKVKPVSTSNDEEDDNNSTNTECEELKETIQDLLQQLEDSEKDHQREQNDLNDEVITLRQKVEQLESAFIQVEHERDEAVAKWNASRKQLEVEKALNASDLKKYQTELQKWKERYLQEKTAQKNATSDMLQKSAVMLGNKLGAGILEGMEEDQTQSTYIIAYGDEDDDDEDDDQSEMVSSISHLGVVTQHNNAPVSVVRKAPSDYTGEEPIIWSPDTKSEQAFEETISIPNFLSQVW